MSRSYKFPHLVTVWTPIGERDIYNKYSLYEVKVLKCRYQPSDRLYNNETGQMVRSNAVIYTENAGVKMGDLVIKGDFRYSETPVDYAFEVKQDISTDNLRGTKTEYKYIL